MLSRQVAYYGLLTCLVALLALGMQPRRAGKVAADGRESSPSDPVQEQEDEEESEEESEEATPIRRKVLVWAHASGEARYIAAISAPRSTSTSLAPRFSADLAARNGIGGPLRL